ncbi:acyl-CoA synthetase [Ectothiorhodospiraceae bacterium WFHF3C12]|nr:acyl-CoA synthetase [Ectothiorhodospiraceae bacterium WFHF3C12]
MTDTANKYERDLEKNAANYVPMSPLRFMERSAQVFPDLPAVVHGRIRRDWAETYTRCRKLASALSQRGFGPGDTVAWLGANTPETFEAHFGVPACGAVLNAINTRLDAKTVAFILDHGESEILFTDKEFADTAEQAVGLLDREITVVDIDDSEFDGGRRIASQTYEEFIAEGDPEFPWQNPPDEWQAITLNYTSGTTGNPKGVVYHHRGAYLNAVSNVLSWDMPKHPVYLWTLPMFHCNGWCFPWTIASVAGVNVCLRAVRADDIYRLIRDEKVTHFCAAPIVLNALNNAPEELKEGIDHEIQAMTAGAAPPAAVIAGMESAGITVTHTYGLTEVYGPVTVCEWRDEWSELPVEEQAKLKARQGVRYVMLDGLMVGDPETVEPVPQDGETMGEIFMRGNPVMKGYLKNPEATEKAFKGGYFHTGDLGVWHPDGYIEIKDRSKDIIISGGENISSLEVEETLYGHPAVMEAAVVAMPDEKWGETPCAFVTLKPGQDTTEDELIEHCRNNMARFKAPKRVVFTELPKTSTGKIQKFVLRDQAKQADNG